MLPGLLCSVYIDKDQVIKLAIVRTENTDCGHRDLINGSQDADTVWICLPASEPWIKVKVKLKLHSRVRLFATPWTVARQAPLFMRFSRSEYWSGLPFPFPWDHPNPGIEPRSPALRADLTVWATREAWMWNYNKIWPMDGKDSSIHGAISRTTLLHVQCEKKRNQRWSLGLIQEGGIIKCLLTEEARRKSSLD